MLVLLLLLLAASISARHIFGSRRSLTESSANRTRDCKQCTNSIMSFQVHLNLLQRVEQRLESIEIVKLKIGNSRIGRVAFITLILAFVIPITCLIVLGNIVTDFLPHLDEMSKQRFFSCRHRSLFIERNESSKHFNELLDRSGVTILKMFS